MRCGAKTRDGSPCRSWGMKNGRCRMHGGTSPGAPKGPGNGNYKHGFWTNEAIKERSQMSEFIREMRDSLP
ncbi:HGGxSTG domain-containing protein [Sneathiella chungangensis]|uniref:HGGxSTG domain-containing protein n=1 Tax=Sneathiella chungangensis TaxID=1418234 RepID=UPI003610657A